MRSNLRIAGLVLPPVAAELLAAPMALSISFVAPRGWLLLWLYLITPFYLGVLCSPGYIYEVVTDRAARDLPVVARWWVRVSLVLGGLCALVGITGSYWMALFLPPSAISAILVAHLVRRFERADAREPRGPPKAGGDHRRGRADDGRRQA